MAKDPRFNFYTDNWIGGTEGFTLEQEGAYLSLIIMQSKVGRFTAEQALDKLMQKTRGNTAVCTALWKFLLPKFKNDGLLYWSVKLETEMHKSAVHSEKQSERVKKRWADRPTPEKAQTVHTAVNTVVLPVIELELELELEKNKKERKPKVEILYPFDSPEFAAKWETWVRYRQEIKKPYKTDISVQGALKMLSEFTEIEALAIIDKSIANQWQGLFPPDKTTLTNNQNGKFDKEAARQFGIANHFANKYGADAPKPGNGQTFGGPTYQN